MRRGPEPTPELDTAAVLSYLLSGRRPATLRSLIEHFELNEEQKRGLKAWLEAQVAAGVLRRVKKNLYGAPEGSRERLVSGRLTTHRDGYGFVIPDTAGQPDVFIPPRALRDAVNGDKVEAKVKHSRDGRAEGEIVRILTRSQQEVVGKVFKHGRQWMAAPLDERYHYTIRLADAPPDLQEGQIVAARIVAQPQRYELPVGEVANVLGFPDDPEIQFKIVCQQHQIPMEFPPAVLEAAVRIPLPDAAEIQTREDLRDEVIVTIDGETARDFDDAISIERTAAGFVLGVHIADVSYYVRPGSALDKEAFLRGTSVYFPDRAIPMLPERLSSGLCSLKPDEDRLTLSVIMTLDRKGRVTDHRFARSIIRSAARMTYTHVSALLAGGDESLQKRYAHLLDRFKLMLELSRILTANRRARGAIDFDLPEAEIEYDLHGEVFDIVRSERNEAHRIIEEFMLLANETVAGHLTGEGVEMIYRTHEKPDPFKAREFARLVQEFGHTLGGNQGEYTAADFQRLSGRLAGKPEERFLSYLMLRSFKQARYSAQNIGHFGLAAECYTHFTSPIRRYPDLVVHRLLEKHILGDSRKEEWQARLGPIADYSSDRERLADEAERDIMKWLMAKFMSGRVGEEYDGFISGVRQHGFFVELLQHFVEGFIHVSKLADDYYVFDERSHRLVGENTGRMFRLGDRLRILVDKVDKDRHLIDFALAGGPELLAARRPKRSLPLRRGKRSGRRRS